MNTLISTSLEKSLTYPEYRALVSRLLTQGLSTGPEQSEALTKYSELNEVRMNRLDKTIVVGEEINQALSSLKGDYIWLVISEGWCGDAAQIVPVLHKMTESNSKISMKVVLRDEHVKLMDQFLTHGARAIPKLLILNSENLEVMATWGPRPGGAAQLIKDYKEVHGVVDETAKTNLQKWYLQDKGQSIMNELVQIMTAVDTQPVTEAV
ncbi:MAG: thioredoxin family protein [Flavobacterium sp.]